jgi:hypothetical protein
LLTVKVVAAPAGPDESARNTPSAMSAISVLHTCLLVSASRINLLSFPRVE